MALGIYFQTTMSPAQYDAVISKLEDAGAGAPDGRAYHCAFAAGENNLHVFDVWNSEEQFAAFGETLMPILASEGVEAGQPDVSPIHRAIVGG